MFHCGSEYSEIQWWPSGVCGCPPTSPTCLAPCEGCCCPWEYQSLSQSILCLLLTHRVRNFITKICLYYKRRQSCWSGMVCPQWTHADYFKSSPPPSHGQKMHPERSGSVIFLGTEGRDFRSLLASAMVPYVFIHPFPNNAALEDVFIVHWHPSQVTWS